MKFVVSKSVLQKNLEKIIGAINSNPVVPILENFLFEVSNGELAVTASDLQVTIKASMNVDVEAEGNICIPAKMLLETVKALPEQPITINLKDDGTVYILSANGRYRLATEPADDFPKSQINFPFPSITVMCLYRLHKTNADGS